MSRIAALALCLALVSPLPAAASPATDLSAALGADSVATGSPLPVRGTLTTAAQAPRLVWTDGPMTSDLGSLQYPVDHSTDLLEGWVERAEPGDPLTLKVKVAAPTGPDLSGKAYQWIRWPFQLEDRWYFIEFLHDGTVWKGSWYYCNLALGSNCHHGTTPPFPAAYDPATRTFTGRIPLADLAAVQPDGRLAQDEMRTFSSQYIPEAGFKYPAFQWRHDAGPAFDSVVVPIESVFYEIVEEGSTDPIGFGQSLPVTTGPDGVTFDSSVPTDGLAPGAYTLYLKGCFGPCVVRTLGFTVT